MVLSRPSPIAPSLTRPRGGGKRLRPARQGSSGPRARRRRVRPRTPPPPSPARAGGGATLRTRPARAPGLLEPVCLAGVVRADPDGDPREDQQEQRSDPECPSHVVPPFDGFRLIGPMLTPGCDRIVNPPGRFRGDPDL